MIYCFDIDGTLCTLSNGYENTEPIQAMIDKVNRLYESNTIKLFTARGQESKVDYRDLTIAQLDQWEVKYHQLIFNKPSADFYIDDKAIRPDVLTGLDMVFTNGCFDIIHAGHIKLLKEASLLGYVIVGLNTDDSVSRIKEGRPINCLEDRMEVLSSIRYVERVIPFDEDTPEKLVREFMPNVIVKGADWKDKDVAEFDFVRSYGGKVVFVDLLPEYSTTGILGILGKTPIKGEF